MKLFKAGSKKEEHVFLFNADLTGTMVLAQWDLRSESVYSEDSASELTALGILKKIHNNFLGKVYLISAGRDFATQNKLRTKKWNLKVSEIQKNLAVRIFEIVADKNTTRLGATINLDGFTYDHSTSQILGWVYGLIVLSTLDIDSLNGYAKRWLQTNPHSVLGFNHEVIARDIADLNSTAILRYFPADNDRSEQLAILCNETFFDETIKNVICAVI